MRSRHKTRKSRSHSRSRSHRSRKGKKWSRSRRASYVLSKKKKKWHSIQRSRCASRRKFTCHTDPNCTWAKGTGCRAKSKKIYLGPSLPPSMRPTFY